MAFQRIFVGRRAAGGEQHRYVPARGVQQSVHAVRGADIDVHHRHLRPARHQIMPDRHVLRGVFMRTRNRLRDRRAECLRLGQRFDQRCEIGTGIREQVINPAVCENRQIGVRDGAFFERLFRHVGFSFNFNPAAVFRRGGVLPKCGRPEPKANRALVVLVLQRPHLRVHRQIVAPSLGDDFAGLEIVAFDRALCHHIELLVPIAERIAVPRRLRF